MNNLKLNKILWLITAIFSIVASIAGVVNPNIYSKLIDTNIIPGAFGQDLITAISALVLILLSFSVKEKEFKKMTIAFGILGYLFYAYGIYVMERVYNSLYLIYLLIFGLSFWSLIFGIFSIKKGEMIVSIPDEIKNFSFGVAVLQPLVFYPLWISALLPLMRDERKIESYYSIYILDLVFIMPAFLILAVWLFKRKSFGIFLSPIIFILGFILIFSLVVSESVKPFFGSTISPGGFIMSSALSALFLFATILHLRKIKFN